MGQVRGVAAPYIRGENISCVHAKELYSTKCEFEGWTWDRKRDFLTGLYDLLRPRVQMGISMSCLKSQYHARKKESGLGQNQSAYGFAFVAAMNAILKDETLGRIARWEGISFILECGNANNDGIIQSFRRIKKQYNADFLRSISEVGKRDCVAIQMADVFAFFTRRRANEMEANSREPPADFDRYLKVIRSGIRDVGRAVTDFHSGPFNPSDS
jgi:hypothetical protein